MSIGFGIFLSAAMISSVLLFIATKNMWPWKKILIRSMVGTLIFCLVCGISIFLYSWYSKKPKSQKTLWGLKLGSTAEDVIFLKGSPISRLNPKNAGEVFSYTD